MKNARNGTFQIYYGALRASGDPAYTVSYRTTILHAIADLTPEYASVLQPQARKQLAELAASTVTKAPSSLRKDLQVIVTGMSEPRCEGLCAL